MIAGALLLEPNSGLTKAAGIEIESDSLSDEQTFTEYWWQFGNGSCDCNRLMYLTGEDDFSCTEGRVQLLAITESFRYSKQGGTEYFYQVDPYWFAWGAESGVING